MASRRGRSGLFRTSILSLLLLLMIPAPSIAQPSPDQLARNANEAFAGGDPGLKAGPLAKAGFDLALAREEFLAFGPTFAPSRTLIPMHGGRVIVDITADDDGGATAAALQALGVEVTGRVGHMISAYLPLDALEGVVALESVHAVRPAYSSLSVGATDSQGDSSMNSDDVRRLFGFDGTGITIGALSDSYNFLGGAGADVTSGDLPGAGNPNGFLTPVNVLADAGTTDEGRAMLQLIHDVAPGSALAFATATGGQATFATNISNLRTAANCDVIVDDVIYFAEPMFQDGVVAQAVDGVVAAGVAYFSSAGNQGRNAYTAPFRVGNAVAAGSIPSAGSAPFFFGGTSHDFDPGAGVDDLQSLTLPNNAGIRVVLQWDQPFFSVSGAPGTLNDVDVYLLDAAGANVLDGSVVGNIGGDAVEVFQFTNTSGGSQNYNLMITTFSGAFPGTMKYVLFGFGGTLNEYATNSGTIYGHANAGGAEAIGAAFYQNTPAFGVAPPVIEPFSSAGTTPILFTTAGVPTFDPRADKPEITAPDGVNNTFFGGSNPEADAFPNFFGTSAAAPHAAAVAGLLLEANNTLTPAQIYSALETTALDMDAAGFDNNTGWGLVQATLALQSVQPCDLTCPADITVANDAGDCGAVVNFSPPATTGTCGAVACVPASGSFFPVGTTTVTCTAASGTQCTFDVTVNDTEPPMITCPADATIECTTAGGTPKTAAAIQAFLNSVIASDNCPGMTVSNDAPDFFAVNTTTTVEFLATDASGNTASCTADVSIVDTTPPSISVSFNRPTLWPPNHKMADIVATVTVMDDCDPNPTFVLTSVTSDEPDNGIGDGNTVNDIQGVSAGTADVLFQLRSERQGGGDGRKYTIVYTASDADGNTATSTGCILVPHDQSAGGLAATGFSSTGETFAPGAANFAVVVPSVALGELAEGLHGSSTGSEILTDVPPAGGEFTPGLDTRLIDLGDVYLGNTAGVIRPYQKLVMDVNDDQMDDAVFMFRVDDAQAIMDASSNDGPLGLQFQMPEGSYHRLSSIFALGEPVELPGMVHAPGPDREGRLGINHEVSPGAPDRTSLAGIHPNPFRLGTSVHFALAAPGHVRLAVYDLRGARVRTLENRTFEAGRYQIGWDGRDDGGRQLARGVYFIRFASAGYVKTQRVVLLR